MLITLSHEETRALALVYLKRGVTLHEASPAVQVAWDEMGGHTGIVKDRRPLTKLVTDMHLQTKDEMDRYLIRCVQVSR